MFKIVYKEILNKTVKKIDIEAEDIARKVRAGQFVVIRIDKGGERIPLTVASCDKNKGTISLIFQEVGFSTVKLGKLNPGDSLLDILGPLGHPAGIKKYGTVICVAGGVGVAEVLPVAGALKEAGNRVIGIIGARSKELIILEDQMRSVCSELYVTTDDGSYGCKGLVTDVLNKILEIKTPPETSITSKDKVKSLKGQADLVYAIGPVAMMEAVSCLAKKYKIKTIVSLNPIMVDGTGMCGSCRVTVKGEVKFCCVDGPDFDGHKIDFRELAQRLQLFKRQEECALNKGGRR